MAWNRPSENGEAASSPLQRKGRRRSPVGGAVAGAVVVIGAAVAAWWLWPRDDGAGETPPPQTKQRIGEAKPAAVAATNRAAGAPVAKAVAETRVTRESWRPGMRPPNVPEGEAWKASRTKIHEVRRFNSNDGPSAYHSASEQMLVELFTTEPGDAPRPIADVPAEERKRLVEILLDKNPPTDKDTEHVKMQKEVLAEAKKELQKYIREGGDPDTFFRYYHDQLLKDWHRREDAAEEIRRIAREEKDPELAKMLYKEVNKKLENDGIKRVVIDGNLFKEEK